MDEHKLQKSTSRLFVNPLDALAIYRRIKDLRAYFTQVVFWNLQHDLRNTVGRRLLDSLFDAVPLVSTLQTERDTETKLAALRRLLVLTRCIYDAVEYLSSITDGRGISLDHAAFMYEILADIEKQDRSLGKALRDYDGGSRIPQQPTGQGASNEIVEGGPPSHSEV